MEPSNMEVFYSNKMSIEALPGVPLVAGLQKQSSAEKETKFDPPEHKEHDHSGPIKTKKKYQKKQKAKHPSAMKSVKKVSKKAMWTRALEENCEESCPVCMETSPNLVLECGHWFHEECMLNMLNAKWSGARITFKFLDCPMCRQRIQVSAEFPLHFFKLGQEISKVLNTFEALEKQVEEISLGKAKEDDLFKDENLAEEAFKAKVLQKVACYMCTKCASPFCGGLVDCAQDLEIDESKLICQSCAFGTIKPAATEPEHKLDADGCPDLRCMTHGYKHAMFKCDSCCNIATFDCIYNHYCDRCHAIPSQPKNFPCPGVEKCTLGIKHPPNLPAVHSSVNPPKPFVLGCMKCIGAEIENHDYGAGVAHRF